MVTFSVSVCGVDMHVLYVCVRVCVCVHVYVCIFPGWCTMMTRLQVEEERNSYAISDALQQQKTQPPLEDLFPEPTERLRW